MPACSGTSLKIVEYFSWLAGTPRSSWYMCAVRNGGNARTLAARAFLQERIRISVQKENGFSPGRERRRKRGKGGQEESEERVGRVLREGKKVWRGRIRRTLFSRVTTKKRTSPASRVLLPRVISARIRKSFPALTRIGSLLEAKSSNSDVI